jgi:hypothetical protein
MKTLFCPARTVCLATALACLLVPRLPAATLTLTPAAVSNTYAGTIALQVAGLTNGEPVIIQKYLDANGNGVVEAGDTLWQQCRLTDGKASVFYDGPTAVTNLDVPGDLDPTPGRITAALNLFLSGFEQTIVGNYLFVLSSPFGNFAPVTNAFTVTSFPFAQSFSGSVTANGTNVPNAVVLLFQPAGKDMNPMGGTVADSAGNYTVGAAPGNYLLVAVGNNFVANLAASPLLTVGSAAGSNATLSLLSATTTLSGRLVDANNATVGLPGMLLPFQSQSGLLGVAFTDTNGSFTAGVTADKWSKIQPADASVAFHGYLLSQNKASADTTTGSVSGLSIALPKASALFYGSVKDSQGQPLAGISLHSGDNSSYQQNSISDSNGNYFAGALSSPSDAWQMQVNLDGNPANYIFSSPAFDFYQNGGTNLAAGQALRANIIGLLATNHITGQVQDGNGHPIPNVQVMATATLGGAAFQSQTDTDGSGNYSLNVGNGTWSVDVSCQGGNDSLNALLGYGNYQCPGFQNLGLTTSNGTANFTVLPCNGIQVLTASPLPPAQVGTYYALQLAASSCTGNLNWSLMAGTPPPGLNLYSGGAFNGTPTTPGTFNFTLQVSDGSGGWTNQVYALTVNSMPVPATLAAPARPANGQFQMTVAGPAGQNYTVQMATNLTTPHWMPLFTTNPVSGVFLFRDGNATNPARFYRVVTGP